MPRLKLPKMPKMPKSDLRLKSMKLTNRGYLLVNGLGLSEIPDADLEEVRRSMPGVV